MQTYTANAANVIGATLVDYQTALPIESGTVTHYLRALTGDEARKYWRASDGTWQAVKSSAGTGSHEGEGHWETTVVADGQNIAVDACLSGNYEWLLLWEDDVIPPPDLFCKIDPYIRNADVPVVSGLYFLKADRVEPILYRGSGTRAFDDFTLGRKVWVDGVPTGMLLIHREVLALMAAESEIYTTLGGKRVAKVFETPAKMFQDPRSGDWVRQQGTSDLAWCKRVMREKVLTRAGWPKIGRRQYPFLCDTSILCRHIDLSTGRQYPSDAAIAALRNREVRHAVRA